jgi:ribosomal protein L37E
VYLWLSQRHEFMSFAPESDLVRAERAEWSMRVDEALNRAVDVSRRCARCGRKMPFNHRHSICDACYHGSRYEDEYYYEPRPKKEKLQIYEPSTSDSCPVCREPIGESAQARLVHWREKHPDRGELSVTYAAWVMNQTKEKLREQLPFDRKAQDGNSSVRLWSIDTLATVIEGKATPTSTLRNLTEG